MKAQDRIDDVIAVGKASSGRDQFESVLQGIEKSSEYLNLTLSRTSSQSHCRTSVISTEPSRCREGGKRI